MIKKSKGLRGDVPKYYAQVIQQIDDEIVKTGTRVEIVGTPREAFGQKEPLLDEH